MGTTPNHPEWLPVRLEAGGKLILAASSYNVGTLSDADNLDEELAQVQSEALADVLAHRYNVHPAMAEVLRLANELIRSSRPGDSVKPTRATRHVVSGEALYALSDAIAAARAEDA